MWVQYLGSIGSVSLYLFEVWFSAAPFGPNELEIEDGIFFLCWLFRISIYRFH